MSHATPEELARQYNRDLVQDASSICERLRSNGTYDEMRKEILRGLEENAAFREQLTAAVHTSSLLQHRDLSDKRTQRAVVEELIRNVGPEMSTVAARIVQSSFLNLTSDLALKVQQAVHVELCAMLEQEWLQATMGHQQQQQQLPTGGMQPWEQARQHHGRGSQEGGVPAAKQEQQLPQHRHQHHHSHGQRHHQ